MTTIIPNITGISELQRKGKKALLPIINSDQEGDVVFLSDRNNLFAAVITIQEYERLMKRAQDKESAFWLNASESSLEFWNDPSNDIYESLL
jgi:hypothetical protein